MTDEPKTTSIFLNTGTTGMTDRQMEIFVTVAQEGVREGLGCPYEWYTWWLASAVDALPFDGPSYMVFREVTAAYAAFFRACLPEEEVDAPYTAEDKRVIEHFRRF